MITLAYVVAALVIPALTLSIIPTCYHVPESDVPDVRFDSEIDREGWAHVERSLYRLEARSHTVRKSRGYATVEDMDTGRKVARAISRPAKAWYELTDDPIVLALEILRQQCDLSWDWAPVDVGHYEMRLTSA